MSLDLEGLVYTKQYILIETADTKLNKSLYEDTELIDIDDYLYSVVTSVTQKTINGVKKHLIQYEDKELGWLELKDSVQIFRFKPMNFQVIERNFYSNDLNKNMGIDKDFISHFKGKLLTIKSEINYKNEKYYSVFLKNKFHGFHHEKHLDPLFEVNIPLTPENINNVELYILSNLTKPIFEIPEYDNSKLLSFFKNNNIGKIQLDNNVYWADLTTLKDIKLPNPTLDYKNIDQLRYEDLLYNVEKEQAKSKEMIKAIISAKDYINDTNVSKQLKFTSNKNSRDDVEELNEELNSIKTENLELKRQLHKERNKLKLAENRLQHQIDYKNRLESQRDKYKSRMQLVEVKLMNLDEKYKKLRNKKISKQRR